MKFISFIFKTFLIVFTTQFAFAQTASILPPAKTTFFDANGNPLVNGKVKFLVPGQTTNKTTWIDSAETTPNTNPVILDSAGRAIILGDGVYRQQVFDQNNNLIWDQLTAAGTGAGGGVTAIGDGNNIGTILPWLGTIPPTGYAFAYGQELNRITFAALFKVATLVQNVTCVGGSPILNTIADTSQLPIGAKVEGSCIPANSTISSKTSSTVTINNNATVNITVSATFFPFGNGNGSNTFNVPDLRGKTIIARNSMGGAASSNLTAIYCGNSQDPNSIGATCGNQSFAMAMVNLPASPAPVTATTSGYTPNVGANVPIIAVGAGSASIQVSSPGTANANVYAISTFFGINGFSSLSVGTNTANLGIDTPFSLMQPSLALNYVIKTTPNITPTILNVVTSLGGQTGDIACGANIVCSGNNIAFSGGSMAQQNANSVAITGGTITGMPSPSVGADVANKTYVDSVASGVLPLPSTNLATAAILPNSPTYANGASGVGATLTAGSNTTLTVDGLAAPLATVVLVKNQVSAFQNGVYTVTTAGSGAAPWVLTRATYFDQAAEMKAGSRTFITSGNTLSGNAYSLLASITTVGTDALNFGLFSSAPITVTSINGMSGVLTCSTGLTCGGNVLQTAPSQFFNVYEYGARTDYHEDSTLSANSGSPNAVSATDHPFSISMIGSLIAINGMGSGANYFGTISGFIDDNHITVTPPIVTTQSNQYGQFCGDQTASIQAAIDAAKAVGGGTVQFPSVGTYCVTQLNATQAVCCQLSLVLQGAGAVAGTRLMPMRNVNAVIDVTGTSPFNMYSISMGLDHQLATPTVGLLIAPTVGNPGIDFYNLNNSFLTGRYTKATFYLDRAASSTCRKVSFINYFQGGGAGYAMVATNNNAYGVTSAFQTTLTGVESVSDWNFTGCEWHTIDSSGGVSLFSAMYLDSAANFQFFGGNAASSNPSIITIAGTTLNLLFQGTTFYSDVGPSPQHVFGGAGNLNRTGLYFTNNIITNTTNGTSGTTTSFVQVP